MGCVDAHLNGCPAYNILMLGPGSFLGWRGARGGCELDIKKLGETW